jgi:CubicO group peptidase (beta-lactamase class C family)
MAAAGLGASSGWAANAAEPPAALEAWSKAQGGAVPKMGRTDALLILQSGRLVFERYGKDHGPGVRHVSWSMAKSITHALAGVAVAQGKVDIDRPAVTLASTHPQLTLRRLLTMTDGLDWVDSRPDPVQSDDARMLYGPGARDTAAYAAARRAIFPPGTRWNYSTGAYQMIARELGARLFPEARTAQQRRDAMTAWMRASLFGPLGMASAVVEFDPAGTFYGGSLVWATARDYARFGELYRTDGVVAGRRILPPGWVQFARTPTRASVYGAGFWLEARHGRPEASLMDGAGPLDAFSAQGHEGQVILIVPSKALTVVRLGLMSGSGSWEALGQWLAGIVNAF